MRAIEKLLKTQIKMSEELLSLTLFLFTFGKIIAARKLYFCFYYLVIHATISVLLSFLVGYIILSLIFTNIAYITLYIV